MADSHPSARILERAGHKCEICQVPNYLTIVRYARWPGWWFDYKTGEAHDEQGKDQGQIRASEMPSDYRIVKIILTVAHLNHTAGDDRDENLKALCQWHHLRHDSEQHSTAARETRITRKDAGRPLLVALNAS